MYFEMQIGFLAIVIREYIQTYAYGYLCINIATKRLQKKEILN